MSDRLYVSRLLLSLRSRQARAELANPYELHRTLSRSFTGDSEKVWDAARCLFRIEEEIGNDTTAEQSVPVLVQTRLCPDWSWHTHLPGYLSGPVAMKELRFRRDADNSPLLPSGTELSFRLVANPTVKRAGKRVGIYDEASRLQWLTRKSEENGFHLGSVRVQDRGAVRCRTVGGEQAVFSAAQFDGTLQIADAEKFSEAWSNGIGAAKGVGFGLLSLARRIG